MLPSTKAILVSLLDKLCNATLAILRPLALVKITCIHSYHLLNLYTAFLIVVQNVNHSFSIYPLSSTSFTFIGYMIIMQAFLTYARIMARMRNNRTPITITNAMADLVKTQLSSAISKQTPGGSKGQGENDMVKGLTSKLLSSESTVMEYDMKQAASARSSLLMPLLFTWVIHFKFGQVQPLFLQASSGIVSLIYSPLFQVYVLGRNLERPFKTGLGAGLKAALGQQDIAKEEKDSGRVEEEDIEEESDEEGEDDDDDGSDACFSPPLASSD